MLKCTLCNKEIRLGYVACGCAVCDHCTIVRPGSVQGWGGWRRYEYADFNDTNLRLVEEKPATQTR